MPGTRGNWKDGYPYLCKGCGETDPARFYVWTDSKTGKVQHQKSWCMPCKNKKRKLYPPSHGQRESNLLRNYGITEAQFNYMLYTEQGGLCGACGHPYAEANSKRAWHVDHNHVTGKIRGVLCHGCNVSLGQAKDDIEILWKLIQYLERTD